MHKERPGSHGRREELRLSVGSGDWMAPEKIQRKHWNGEVTRSTKGTSEWPEDECSGGKSKMTGKEQDARLRQSGEGKERQGRGLD